ncbi:MAG: prephenate dehydratase [Deltaproteobacteria bacterium]|nr:prephenate dehydratase [Candidatus Anaeroferrophillus wilburensis]MBN2889357.1 prephenate dehydratase [Deltaproteobacteria bacterium]
MSNDAHKERISKLRQNIDRLDLDILALLNQRAQLAAAIGEEKKVDQQQFYAPAREQEIYQRLEQHNQGPLPARAVRHIFREIISASLALEKPVQVGYLGPRGTFTHLAAQKFFGYSAELQPAASIREVFESVEKQRYAYGVVPVENTTEGIVSHTLDMFSQSQVKISGEILLQVSHDLLSQKNDPGTISKIYSHPHAIAQCRNYLEEHFPQVPVIAVSSTAQAAAMAAEEPGTAAIANEYAASLYHLQVVESAIQDLSHNLTRFLIIATRETPHVAGESYKTTVLFSAKDQAGSLFVLLKPFADHGVNLTKIESRPRRGEPWHYIFFLDIDGHREEPPVAAALKELEASSQYYKIVGSYATGKI